MSIIGIGTKIVDLRRGIGSGSGGGGAAFSTKSLDFDGVDDYVATGNTFSDLDGGTTMTLSVWVKPITGNTFYMIAHNPRDIIAQNSQFLLFFYSGFLELSLSTRSQFVRADSSAINMDAWNHILCCVDLNNTTEAKIYINGEDETTSDNLSSFNAFEVASGIMRIAEEQTGYLTPFLGNIDEFSIWDTDQRANVAEIFNGGIPDDLNNLATVPAPNLWYRMGENSTFSSQILMPEQNNKDKFSNYSMAFDGTDDYVDTGITNTGTNDISVSCWIKTKETFVYTNSRCAFGGRNNGSLSNYSLGRLGSDWATPNDMKVRVFNTFGTTKLNDGDWHNIIYTYDYTTKEVKAYVDGNATPEVTFTIASWSTNYIIAIGWNGFDTAYCFEGNVDECAYFTRVLGASDITEIYNSGTPADISGISDLVSWWRMGEDATFSTNWTIPDQVGSNTGTSANMTIDDLIGEAPTTSGNGISDNMDIYDRTGDAPDSSNNALSYNMVEADIVEEAP